MISDVIITKKSYQAKASTTMGKFVGKRYLWDVEYTLDGEVKHALFSTEDEAKRYATVHLGYAE